MNYIVWTKMSLSDEIKIAFFCGSFLHENKMSINAIWLSGHHKKVTHFSHKSLGEIFQHFLFLEILKGEKMSMKVDVNE